MPAIKKIREIEVRAEAGKWVSSEPSLLIVSAAASESPLLVKIIIPKPTISTGIMNLRKCRRKSLKKRR